MTISKTVTLNNITHTLGTPKSLLLETLSGSVGLTIPAYGSVTEDLYKLQLDSNISDVLASWITDGKIQVKLEGTIQTANQVPAWKYSLDTLAAVTLQTAYALGNTIVTDVAGGDLDVSGTEKISLASSNVAADSISINASAGGVQLNGTLHLNDALVTQGFFSAPGTQTLESGQTGSGSFDSVSIQAISDLTANGAKEIKAARVYAQTAAGNSFDNTKGLAGLYSGTDHLGDGDLDYLRAGFYNSFNWGTGTVTNISGVYILNGNISTGTVTNCYGAITGCAAYGGLIVNSHGFYVLDAGGATITNQTGLTVEALAGATNNTQLLLGTTTIPSGNYAIYSASANESKITGIIELADGSKMATSAAPTADVQLANKKYVDDTAAGGAGLTTYATVALAEAATGTDNDLCYVVETETTYRYEAAGSAFTDDNTYVLSTNDAGDTRWLGVSGQYSIANGNSKFLKRIDTGAWEIPQTGVEYYSPKKYLVATARCQLINFTGVVTGSLQSFPTQPSGMTATDIIHELTFYIGGGSTARFSGQVVGYQLYVVAQDGTGLLQFLMTGPSADQPMRGMIHYWAQ